MDCPAGDDAHLSRTRRNALREPARYTLFDTAIGRCGIAWRGDRICAVRFPESDDRRTAKSLVRGCGDAMPSQPTSTVLQAIARIRHLLDGEDSDLADIAIDLDDASDFERRVYAEALKIPRGETRTYGDIAAALGDPRTARSVGQALGHNPVPIIVPCHRVLAANGKSGGFSGAGGVPTKLRLLKIEGAMVGDHPNLFDHVGVALQSMLLKSCRLFGPDHAAKQA